MRRVVNGWTALHDRAKEAGMDPVVTTWVHQHRGKQEPPREQVVRVFCSECPHLTGELQALRREQMLHDTAIDAATARAEQAEAAVHRLARALAHAADLLGTLEGGAIPPLDDMQAVRIFVWGKSKYLRAVLKEVASQNTLQDGTSE